MLHKQKTTSLVGVPSVSVSPTIEPLRFSEIASVLRCPVVGICLTPAEQRKLVKKSGMLSTDACAFDVHEILVSITDEDNSLSRRADALLRKKYDFQAAPLRELDLLEFIKCWDMAFASGSFAAVLWAAATRRDMPLALQRHIFGCVHMSMHDALEKNLLIQERLRTFREERLLASEKFREIKSRLASAHKEIRNLKVDYASLSRSQTLLNHENQRLKEQSPSGDNSPSNSLKEENSQLHLELAERTKELHEAQSRTALSERQLADTLEEIWEQRQFIQQLQEELEQMAASMAGCKECAAECKECEGSCAQCECSSCPRRILIVGGMQRMESLYRQLIESKGDVLEYHDGYFGSGGNKLENCLQRADLVLCPVNCNSHRACRTVKNLCKKHNKPVHMMENFSLSAVSRVIFQEVSATLQQ